MRVADHLLAAITPSEAGGLGDAAARLVRGGRVLTRLPIHDATEWAVFGAVLRTPDGVTPELAPFLAEMPGWPMAPVRPVRKGLHLIRRALPELEVTRGK